MQLHNQIVYNFLMTPHINASKKDIAQVVLMPGDPLRAKFIAEKFLTNCKLVSKVRNMFFYTGYYKEKKVTIAGSGMGQPSIGIYSYELFKFYNVEKIIRIGSSGSYIKDLKLYDLVLVDEAYSESSFIKLNNNKNILSPSIKLNQLIQKKANELKINVIECRVHSTDLFYDITPLNSIIKKTNAWCVDMEAYALFAISKLLNKEAACLLTISDNLITNEEASIEEREKTFINMMKLSLETAIL